jgi:DUF438 domain-containing protein
MDINKKTKILPLIEQFPHIYNQLLKLSPKIKRLKNPIVRRTIGKNATIKDVSKLIDVDLSKILQVIEESMGKTSEEIEELKTQRKEQLKELVIDMHKGAELEELKHRFKEIIVDASPSEIGEMEQSLIDEGVLEPEQITELCDIHVELFKDMLEEKERPETISGHPIHTYMEENKIARDLILKIRSAADENKLELLKELAKLEIHYTRIENQLFPILENLDISGPAQVLWAVHDEIRAGFKENKLENIEELLEKVDEMVYKEEHILFPMALEKFKESDWARVKQGEEEIGYVWVRPGDKWKPVTDLDTGKLSLEQINLMLKHLPIDVSFVDVNDEVKYYSATDDRIFPRSPAVIGRKVEKCHPPKSVHIVKDIVAKFKSGEKNVAEFWIQLGDKFVNIRYFAVRDTQDKYIGTLEVSQDVTHIKSLEGERRLVQWGD